MIASGGLSEWLTSTAHVMVSSLITSKFSFLAFECLNVLFAAISDNWDLKAPAILFFKYLFSTSLPQHYLRIFGNRCLTLAGSLDSAESKELHTIVSHRHKPKGRPHLIQAKIQRGIRPTDKTRYYQLHIKLLGGVSAD